jgi:acetate kinase
MNVVVVNAGSASLKFQLVRTDPERLAAHADEKLARGLIERIGGEAVWSIISVDGTVTRGTARLRDHRAAVEWLLPQLAALPVGLGSVGEIHAAGHRVVHGGERFRQSVRITDDVIRGIEENIALAPLHNPHNLKGIQAVRAVLGPDLPQVAVFDTAFHHTLPERSYLYAIPYQMYRRHRVRRYGFHGTSHRYIAWRFRMLTKRAAADTNVITLHLGNGCSACAISAGRSVDTSMGFTPLEGLMMGTRSGDVDPGIIDYISGKEGLSPHDVERLLYSQSGLLGVSGLTNDMRELLAEAREHDDRRAKLAIELFAYRVRKQIGAYLAALGGAQAIVFSGGIGENAAAVREQIISGLSVFGLAIDPAANAEMIGGREGRISPDGATPEVWVIPTDEELLIARDTLRVVEGLELPA